MDTQDLDLTASSDGRLRCRWKGLHGSVVGEHDRAMAALADAHDDPRLSADQIAKRRRLAAFNPPQCGEETASAAQHFQGFSVTGKSSIFFRW